MKRVPPKIHSLMRFLGVVWIGVCLNGSGQLLRANDTADARLLEEVLIRVTLHDGVAVDLELTAPRELPLIFLKFLPKQEGLLLSLSAKVAIHVDNDAPQGLVRLIPFVEDGKSAVLVLAALSSEATLFAKGPSHKEVCFQLQSLDVSPRDRADEPAPAPDREARDSSVSVVAQGVADDVSYYRPNPHATASADVKESAPQTETSEEHILLRGRFLRSAVLTEQMQLPRVTLQYPADFSWIPARAWQVNFKNEKKLSLNGVATFGYSRYHLISTLESGFAKGLQTESQGRQLGYGLDLHFGTYVLDPRFIKLGFDTSYFRDRGAFDNLSTNYGNTGAGFNLEFLPHSFYPLRFHYTRQNSHFLQNQLSTARNGEQSLGLDWNLRKPHFPNLFVNFASTSYDSRFLASSSFKSRSRSLNVNLTDTFKGWVLNSNFSHQTAVEGITGLDSSLNFLRFDARLQLTSNSTLMINSLYENLHFFSETSGQTEKVSFLDVRTDWMANLTQKLNARLSYQLYTNNNEQQFSASGSAGPRSAPGTNLQPVRLGTSFNEFDGQVSYRLFSGMTVGTSAGARFISAPEEVSEFATRFLDVAAFAAWNKRIKFLETRASFSQGVESAASNFGNSRNIRFHSYSAGFSLGKSQAAILTVDYNSSLRPDIFDRNGFFSQDSLTAGVESQALRAFKVRLSIGENDLLYLTTRGREHFRNTSASASLDHRLFTLLFGRHFNLGLRDVFLAPVSPDPRRIFRILPVDTLVRDDLLNTSGRSTYGLFRFKPARSLDIEVRYLDDKSFFVRTNDVFGNQIDFLVTYRLGKFTFSGGAILYKQRTEGLLSSRRTYYFFRVSRPFVIF